MRWRVHDKESKVKRLEQWHRWFAWRPIQIGDYRYWLCHIYRRGDYRIMRDYAYWTWDYCANEFELLKKTSEEK